MAIVKRLFYFFVVNAVVLLTISIATSLICQLIYGTPYPPTGSIVPIVIWAGIWGMGGAFFSLFASKAMAKRMTGMVIIDPQTRDPYQRKLVDTVHEISRRARLPKMPEVGIYQSPDMNAFATGPSKSNSLVAVSTGLLEKMSEDEVEGVLAHEVAHVANGDMVTLTLIQGVINAFVLFLARFIAEMVASSQSEDSSESGSGQGNYFLYWVTYIGLQLIFSVLGSMVVSYFSRSREFRADSGEPDTPPVTKWSAPSRPFRKITFQKLAKKTPWRPLKSRLRIKKAAGPPFSAVILRWKLESLDFNGVTDLKSANV